MRNYIDECNLVKANYCVDKSNRYLDIYCFDNKEIIFHGYYDFNYSFAVIKVLWTPDFKCDCLVNQIFSNEWPYVAYYRDFYKLIEYAKEDTYASIRLSYMCKDQSVSQYMKNSMFTDFVKLDSDDIGLFISNQVNTIYTIDFIYDEKSIIQKLIHYKDTITRSNPMDFEPVISNIERELTEIQYVTWGSMDIQNLYKECRCLCSQKYNEYMNICR